MAGNDYKWNTNSREERQSDFSQSSFSATKPDASARSGPPGRGNRRRGARTTLYAAIFLVAVVLLGAALLYLIAR